MGTRFESNYNRIAGIAPLIVDDANPLARWVRVHEWQVDDGYTGRLMGIMLNVEPSPLPAPPVAANFGSMRVAAMLDTAAKQWVTKFQVKMIGAAMTARQATPRLVILPCGSGITFTAEQGLMTQALGGVTTIYRWWSCYAIDSQVA